MKSLCLPVMMCFALHGLIPPLAMADGCRRVVVQTHAAPAYVAPTHAAPVYAAQHYDYHDTVIVAKAFRVLVAPDYYSTVADEYRQAIFAELVAAAQQRQQQAAARLAAERQDQTEAARHAPDYPAPRPPVLPPAIPPATPPQLIPPAAPVAGGIPAKLRELVAARCASCHTGGANGINLSEANLARLTRDQWNECVVQISGNDMPKGAKSDPKKQLNQEELDLFFLQAKSVAKVAKK